MPAATTGYQYRVFIQAYRGKHIRFRISMMGSLDRPFMRKCRPNMREEIHFCRPDMREQVDLICVEKCRDAHRCASRVRLHPVPDALLQVGDDLVGHRKESGL